MSKKNQFDLNLIRVNAKDIFFFQDGKNGRNEEFVSYPKEGEE